MISKFNLFCVFLADFGVCLITVIVGEIANFVAYIYAPAVLVTPLGALSIIVSAVLAHFMLKEKLQRMGMLGCLMCIVGSTVIVLHAPQEKSLTSVQEIWLLAVQSVVLPVYLFCGFFHSVIFTTT
ncbi:probable magnesium transporter NIPA6 isoform X1 [Arachis ipaensis]|uniref:probable magnesium transporter NIPA6 isoform X1 n=1 Tax=Arachis ipaensis TaxID=130454 RepID=UPI000A2B4D50|nr:probable magnesium transporter NIPA6 isoform X1 [Arachis ipaensis]